MKIIGLTGQTGAGKSTAAKILTEYGCVHIDADSLAKTVILSSQGVLDNLKKEFGADIFNNGSLDRKELAKRAFSSFQNTKRLNDITHPAVTEAIRKIIAAEEEKGTKAVIIDAIALIESGENALCDFTVAVIAPENERIKRIIERDKITAEQAKLRVNAQRDENFYASSCDFVVRNYGEYNMRDEMRDIIAKILDNNR